MPIHDWTRVSAGTFHDFHQGRTIEIPLFLAPGWYVNVPLEQTYAASWDVTPKPIRDLVAPPLTAVQQP